MTRTSTLPHHRDTIAMPVTLSDFQPLRPAEAKLVAWLQAGNREVCVISPAVPPEDAPDEVRLRASFVRYLALGGCDACRPSEKGLRVAGAFIESDGPEWAETRGLDLEGCRLPGDLGMFGCRFPDAANLLRVALPNLFFSGSHFAAGFYCDGATIKGDLLLNEVHCSGEARLLGAHIEGVVNVDNARLDAAASSIAINCDGLRVKGDFALSSAEAIGEVRLMGVSIGGQLAAANVKFFAKPGSNCISADEIDVSGALILQGSTLIGEARFIGAKVGGNLEATGAKFRKRGSTGSLSLDSVSVEGSVFLRGALINGNLELSASRITRSLQFSKATRLGGKLELTASEIGEIVDPVDSWPAAIELDRCRYGAFVAGAPTDAESRIRWLSLQDGAYPAGTFHPQPWEECARALREAGHAEDARKILIEKDKRQWALLRDRTFRSSLNLGPALAAPIAFADFIFYRTTRYGRQPLRAFIPLLAMWCLGVVVFGSIERVGAIKPNLPQVLRAAEWVQCAEGGARRAAHITQVDCFLAQPEAASYPRFNPIMYAADTLFPVVSFEVQAYWLPDDRTPQGSWARVYLWVHITMGWALTLLAVAGFSGLVKNDSK